MKFIDVETKYYVSPIRNIVTIDNTLFKFTNEKWDGLDAELTKIITDMEHLPIDPAQESEVIKALLNEAIADIDQISTQYHQAAIAKFTTEDDRDLGRRLRALSGANDSMDSLMRKLLPIKKPIGDHTALIKNGITAATIAKKLGDILDVFNAASAEALETMNTNQVRVVSRRVPTKVPTEFDSRIAKLTPSTALITQVRDALI